MRSIRGLAAILLLLGTTCVATLRELVIADEPVAARTGAVPKPAPETKPLDCTIHAERTCELGKAPKITVTITNRTKADIYLVGSLDASDCQWRYPHCYFEVTRPDGKSAVQERSRCGYMNALREKDFVKVPPGKALDPYRRIDQYGFFSAHQLDQRTFRTACEYRIRFVYSTKSDTIAQWRGKAADEKIAGMFKQVPKVEVRSNEIKVCVVEPGRKGAGGGKVEDRASDP
jgi:hypothetical protein